MSNQRLVILAESLFAILSLLIAGVLAWQGKDSGALGFTGLAGLAIGNLTPGPLPHPRSPVSKNEN